MGKSIIARLRQEKAVAIAADLYQDEVNDMHIHCDITDKASIDNCIGTVLKQHGRIDSLVNCAYPRTSDWGAKFEQIDPESWRKNVDMQLNSVFVFCQSVIPYMVQNGSGSIVNISSIYGSVGPDFSVYEGLDMTMPAAYAVIKGGLNNFTNYLAALYGPEGIRVNTVSPGGIFDHQPESFVKKYEAKVPLRRMGAPEDISPSVAFLLSEDAKYITGHNLMVDGGWTAI